MSRAALAGACAALASLAAAHPARAQADSGDEPRAAAPTIEVMGDSMGIARLAAGVLGSLRNGGVHASKGFFVLRADSANANLNGSFVGSDVPERAFAGARPAIVAFLRARPDDRPFHVSFRLNEETLAVVGGEWDWRWEQGPELRNGRHIDQRLHDILRITSDERAWQQEAEVTFLISPAGNVVLASITSSSGDWNLDKYLLNLAYEMRWEPARKNDQPVPGWMRYRFTLRRIHA